MVAPDSLADGDTNTSKGCDETSVTNGSDNNCEAGDEDRANDVLSNGNEESNKTNVKQPSYVGLACCISGYTTLSYDSRIRSLSPITPLNTKVNRNGKLFTTESANCLVPRDLMSTNRMQTQDKGVDYLNGSSLHSPRHISISNKEARGYTTKSMFVSESYSSYSSVSSSSSVTTCFSSLSDTTATNCSINTVNTNECRETRGRKVDSSTDDSSSPSSFIMQRVERLYGPGALAQGFYTRRMKTTWDQTKEVNKREGEREEKAEDLPVLKLLRPEFRAQLSLASRKTKFTDSDSPNPPREEPIVEASQTKDKYNNISHSSEIKEPKDGNYYLKRLEEEVGRLEGLAAMAERELESCTNEEGSGILRAAAGKARLLVAQKLHQFRGLCTNNIKQSMSESFPTTNEDLAGFWDMVMIQVKQILTQFEQIKVLKANDWVQPEFETSPKSSGGENVTNGGAKSVINRGGKSGGGTKKKEENGGMRKARDEARRKILEEKRRALKSRGENCNDNFIIL